MSLLDLGLEYRGGILKPRSDQAGYFVKVNSDGTNFDYVALPGEGVAGSPIVAMSYTESPVPVPVGVSYTQIITHPEPAQSTGMVTLGARFQVWEQQILGSELAIADEILISVRNFGGTRVLRNVETGASANPLTGTFASGAVGWRVTVSGGLVRFELLQTTAARRAHLRVWASEELATDWT